MNSAAPEKQEFNGHWWLFNLTYGVEKQKAFRLLEKNLRRKNILDILVEGGETERAAAKFRRAKSDLDALLHTEVVITPLDSDDAVPVKGMLEKIDFDSGTVNLLIAGDNATIRFCEISEHSVYGFTVIPIVTMQAEKEYKF